MMKSVLFGEESRKPLLAGIQKITNAVRVTMGAAGRCVMIGNAVYGNDGLVALPTIVSKDGWQVTKHFLLHDAVENRGAMLIKEAATKTVEMAGDATTATCVLAEAMISEGVKMIDNGYNPQVLKKQLDEAVAKTVKKLNEISTPARDQIERVRQIATVSANNDTFIGDLIAEAFKKIGFDGVIDIEKSNTSETSVKTTDGVKIERGWISPLFVNNPAKETTEFDNPFILLYDKKITHHTQIQTALSIVQNAGKPLLIICEDVEQQGLGFLALNNHQKRVSVCAIKCPDFGVSKAEWMEDIALLTGATYISDIRGIDIKKVNEGHLGKAKKILVSKNETVIVEGEAKEDKLEDFLNNLKMNLTQAKTEAEKAVIEKRIARLSGQIAVIEVGGVTETEFYERLDRVDDSVRATKAAIAEGFVPGGGTAFLRCLDLAPELPFFNEVLKRPLRQICSNAGIENIDDKIKEVIAAGDNNGFNVLTNTVEDMVKAGIIDSTKAIRCALTNAASVAGMFLTSECSIIQIG
jgi:chaperonin GroEL